MGWLEQMCDLSIRVPPAPIWWAVKSLPLAQFRDLECHRVDVPANITNRQGLLDHPFSETFFEVVFLNMPFTEGAVYSLKVLIEYRNI